MEGIDIIQHVAAAKSNVERTLYWRKPRGDTVWKGVRVGSLKYIGQKRGDTYREHLFDLAADRAEKMDLKASRPHDFQRLKAMYVQWEEKVRRNRRGRPE